ncbi:MAG: DNA mismatch repair protein MutS [Gemmatimonadota bacterium]
MTSPHAEYTARLEARQVRVVEAQSRAERIVRFRLILWLVAGLAIWFLRGRVHAGILLGLPVALFVGLVVAHVRTRRALARAERAAAYYARGLRRLAGHFAGVGETGAEWLDDAHPYANHLDIFGVGSLYELLCGARTAAGRRTLADWLLQPAEPEEILARQEGVGELRDRIDFREDLAVLDDEIVEALGADDLVAWATAPSPLPTGAARIAALVLAGATLAAAIASIWLGPPPLVWVLLANFVFWLPLRKRVQAVIEGVERPAPSFRQIQRALERIEREAFHTERTGRIDSALGSHDPPASVVINGLLKRVDALEARENMMFAPISLALLWGTNCSFAIERWRAEHGSKVGGWIAAVGELEALLDLSTLAYEHPEYAFPTVTRGEPRVRAEGMAHPLLLQCTPNDVAVGGSAAIPEGTERHPDMLVVTGSNMSGKSTLLRTVGVNVVLAQAGAPVRASSMDMSPVAIGASIRTLDSLLDGASRFYAEIHAIKRAVDQAENSPPGLFLLDELLHGTNSEDRRIGAEAVVRAFLDRGAIGIITTHDLALAAIADGVGPRARNAHFEFALDEGEIRFDYTLHPGTVKAGNALAIMRAAGLDV